MQIPTVLKTQRLRLASPNEFTSVKCASSDYLNSEISDSTTPAAIALDDSTVESNTIDEVYAGF